ncbi:unnamed protein product [Blepharisma stoltei]|uniref:non-specific serine/threonine protein kinase n=1 Tax=Blepharisma stoltei TaxID=1481888 RepID=A0AAU9JGK4_9CILI|nr:unnamed protein product [Blepharisma stoltei]
MAYSQIYKELGVIGRGNFGSAHLVEHQSEHLKYVAKKILLGGMTDREIQGAHQEAELLSRLNHPNIVKYKESFCEEGLLIIVMEYCDVGDLSYHIKQKSKKHEIFTETEIMNWFVQICLALQYIHSLGILHRDIKSSNIYLTGNNTVKLGDFGISRVLQGSEAANTVVGTPYYMSPEVCENKPYSYKSDAWSLGCVLYELCTLNYAFKADNLLGLVFKIVTERAEPIPSHYSPQLRTLVQDILVKDSGRRPSVSDILNDPYTLSFMQNFIDTNGQSLTRIRSLNIRKATAIVPQRPKSPENETPKQRLIRKKREQAEQEAEKLKNAAREAYIHNQVSKQRAHDMLYSSPQQRYQNQAAIQKAMSPPSNFSGSGSTIASLVFTKENSYDRQGNYGTLTDGFNLTETQYSQVNNQGYNQDYLEDSLSYSNTFEASQYEEAQQSPSYINPRDEQPIKAAGYYNLNFTDDSSEIAENNEEELTEIVSVYRNQMRGGRRLDTVLEASGESASYESPRVAPANKKDSMRQQCIEKMGSKLFGEIYEYLKRQRQIGTADDVIIGEAKRRWGKDATTYSFLVDQLLFLEIFH